jgi:O-antigen ligase
LSSTAVIENPSRVGILDFFLIGGLPGGLFLLRNLVYVLVLRQREAGEMAAIDVEAGVQALLTGLVLLAGVYFFLRHELLRYFIRVSPFRWLFLFYGLALFSALWSLDPVLTLYRATEAIAYSLLIFAVVYTIYLKVGAEGLLRWVVAYSVYAILLGSLGRIKLLGFQAFGWTTFLEQQMTSTPFFFLALLFPISYWLKVPILSISFLSLSNTAYLGMAAGAFALKEGNRYLKAIFFFGGLLVLVGLLVFGTEQFLQNTVFFGKKGVGLEYTSGRDQIAALSWNAALERPLYGYGFVAGEVGIISESRGSGVIGAHNGLLSALLGMGFPGGILIFVFLVHMWRVAQSSVFPDLIRSALYGTFLMILVHTLGNPGIGSRVYGTWIPSVLLLCVISVLHAHFKQLLIHADHLGNP